MIHDFDPWQSLENLHVNQQQLDSNQKQIVLAVNNWQKTLQDHENRLDLNQVTINQMLASLQNQQKLILTLLDKFNELQAVNKPEDPKQ
jgi:hypothetical protein